MQRIISFLLLLFLPLAALADGMVIPTIAYPAKITIPDQRALICYSNDTERLVIETRFTGSGTNFAWVVPLPSQPVIEEATTGLFPTLQYLFRPQIVHNVPEYYIGILFALGFVYVLWRAAQSVWNAFVMAFVLGLLFVLAAMLLPALSAAKTKGMTSGSSEEDVSILDRKIVGIFETITITSHDAKALQTWLSENGFAVPTSAEPVIESYVKDGWVFVAMKVRRDKPDSETSTPHPLSFSFKTGRPVYPMRLTGVDNGPLSVELYVFSSARAEAAHFKVESCTRPNIAHPLLHQWVGDLPAATKLKATLSPTDMRNDVWLDWTPFLEKKNRLFSQQGALTIALNWGTGLFAAGLLAICILLLVNETYKSKFSRLVGIVAISGLGLAGLIYLCLPKMEVRLLKFPRGIEEASLFQLYQYLLDTNLVTHAEVSAQAQHLLANPTNDAEWVQVAGRLKNLDNYLLGGRIREEDSPGNFTLRENGNQLEFVTYDAQGAERIWSWTWELRPSH